MADYLKTPNGEDQRNGISKRIQYLEEMDVNTEQKVLRTNWNYFTPAILFKFHTYLESAQGLMPTKRSDSKFL